MVKPKRFDRTPNEVDVDTCEFHSRTAPMQNIVTLKISCCGAGSLSASASMR